jgi:predicted SAM-dependent methyltransferase
LKLHIGAGTSPIAGWTNVDILPYPGVDTVLDVTQGLPFTDVEMIFAEHFLEHLTLADGLRFLAECRRALNDDGVLRISTPNLDWVWLTHYKQPDEMTPDEQLRGCLEINRAFHGWGHRFLYNRHMLRSVLERSGFRDFVECEYGLSAYAALNGLERHELSDGLPGSPSVLIVEASGRVAVEPEMFDTAIAPYVRDFGTT